MQLLSDLDEFKCRNANPSVQSRVKKSEHKGGLLVRFQLQHKNCEEE